MRAWSQVVVGRCPDGRWGASLGGASAHRITSGRLLPGSTFAHLFGGVDIFVCLKQLQCYALKEKQLHSTLTVRSRKTLPIHPVVPMGPGYVQREHYQERGVWLPRFRGDP